MAKLDDFKDYIKTKPNVITKIHNGEYTWQQVYEIYDIHGENHSLFKNEKSTENTKENNSSLNNALKMFQDIDMDKVSANLASLQKVLNIFSEFGKNNNSVNKTHNFYKGRYQRYND